MTVLAFAPRDRWLVTVESERRFVNVRHRTYWYAVARRFGHEQRELRGASRSDAEALAEIWREALDLRAARERDPDFLWFRAWYRQQPRSVQTQFARGQTDAN